MCCGIFLDCYKWIASWQQGIPLSLRPLLLLCLFWAIPPLTKRKGILAVNY